jgi:DNA-binding winged helix-turn-helix (wHTH) protein
MSRNAPEIGAEKYETLRIGKVVYSPATKRLQGLDGSPVELRSQSTEVLAYLAARPGDVIPKDELFSQIWGETFVTDDSLVQCISEIRRLVGDEDHKIIQTLPKKGYRLNVAAIEHCSPVVRPAKTSGSMLRLGAVAAVFAAVVLGWLLVGQDRSGTNFMAGKPRIAILPFCRSMISAPARTRDIYPMPSPRRSSQNWRGFQRRSN